MSRRIWALLYTVLVLIELIRGLERRSLSYLQYFYDGAFGRLVGFWFSYCEATLGYLGAEIIGIVAEETERPRVTLPVVVH